MTPEREQNGRPEVSITLLTHNAGPLLPRLLDALARQETSRRVEVAAIVEGLPTETAQEARPDCTRVAVKEPEPKPRAENGVRFKVQIATSSKRIEPKAKNFNGLDCITPSGTIYRGTNNAATGQVDCAAGDFAIGDVVEIDVLFVHRRGEEPDFPRRD